MQKWKASKSDELKWQVVTYIGDAKITAKNIGEFAEFIDVQVCCNPNRLSIFKHTRSQSHLAPHSPWETCGNIKDQGAPNLVVFVVASLEFQTFWDIEKMQRIWLASEETCVRLLLWVTNKFLGLLVFDEIVERKRF